MPSEKSHSDLYTRKILAAVLDFLVATGASHADLRAIVESKLSVMAPKRRQSAHPRTTRQGDDTVSSAVLHRWHRDSKLIGDDAMPLPLALYGPAPSVEALVKSERPSRPAKAIVGDMVALGLIRRSTRGRYLPKARVATIQQMHPVLMEHVAKSLVRLLETVQRNTTASSPTTALIERFTHIPDLPVSKVSEFTTFAQDHGSNFLASVDDWLEARRVRNTTPKRPGISAGIHVYAYIERAPGKKLSSRAKRA